MRLGVLGAADINEEAVFQPSQVVDEVELAAIAARVPARAEAVAHRVGIQRVYPTYADLLADSSLDAIYIPLPNSLHAKWAIAALEAGHHVLCEKPLTSNAAQAEQVVAAARRNQRVMVEAFHWRYHPVAARMIELAGKIGPLERLEAYFKVEIPSTDIRWQLDLAGGSFMDLGCYCVHMVRSIVGTEPQVLSAKAVEGPQGVDVSMDAELAFPGGPSAAVGSSMVATTVWPSSMTVRAYGQGGELEVKNPMAPQYGHHISARLADGSVVDEVLGTGTTYEFQMRAFCRVLAGEEQPLTGGADSVNNMAVLDAVYEASGLGLRP